MNRPLISKTAAETAHELRMWRGSDRITHCHSDGSGELAWVCKYEGISHDKTEPGDAQSNGVAEAYVGISKFGTRTNLRQAGLPHPYWHWALAYHEVSWNVTPHERPDPIPWHARFFSRFHGDAGAFWGEDPLCPCAGFPHLQAPPTLRFYHDSWDLSRLGHGRRMQIRREVSCCQPWRL